MAYNRCDFCNKHCWVMECYECLLLICDDEFCQSEHDQECIESDLWGD